MSMQPTIPLRFYSLDVIRGLAALSVVFWHWQHFFFDGSQWAAFAGESQPFYSLFFVLYQKGWLAVDFFFSLSGFIFFWLYAGSINAGRVNGWQFFILRMSRLYPLHIATFLLVWFGQALLRNQTGDYFVYPNNDLYHAWLHVFMASAWGVERGWSFNGPVWSVSIEVLLYALFFVACLWLRMRLVIVLLLAAAGVLLSEINPLWGRGLFSFFIGGLTFRLYRKLNNSEVRGISGPLLLFAAALWLGTILEVRYSWFWPQVGEWLLTAFPHSSTPLVELQKLGGRYFVTGALFPLTILGLALAETRRGHLGRRLSMLGDISYSSYLLHFPLQLVMFAVVAALGIDQAFFYSEASLLLFFFLLIPLCLLSYHGFELPVQKMLRHRLLQSRRDSCTS